MHGDAKENMVDSFFIHRNWSFFKRSILSDITKYNQHQLILDEHGSHVTLEAIKQAQEFGLYVVMLPFHIFMPRNHWMWVVSNLSR